MCVARRQEEMGGGGKKEMRTVKMGGGEAYYTRRLVLARWPRTGCPGAVIGQGTSRDTARAEMGAKYVVPLANSHRPGRCVVSCVCSFFGCATAWRTSTTTTQERFVPSTRVGLTTVIQNTD